VVKDFPFILFPSTNFLFLYFNFIIMFVFAQKKEGSGYYLLGDIIHHCPKAAIPPPHKHKKKYEIK